MKTLYRKLSKALLAVLVLTASGCNEFLEVGAPETQLPATAVFETTATADAAMGSIYAKLRASVLVTGTARGLSVLLGQYGDELTSYNATGTEHPFYLNGLTATNSTVYGVWKDSYNLVYACNAILEGVAPSAGIPQADKDRLMGEALLVRSYIHFYLMQLFGDVPYVTTTDYQANSSVHKLAAEQLYPALVLDVFTATSLLPENYLDVKRVRPVKAVAHALMARLQLYRGNWGQAEQAADAVIGSPLYTWVSNLDNVFLKASTGTLWQLMPPTEGQPTAEGQSFILTAAPGTRALAPALAAAFEPGDQRRVKWVGTFTNASGTWHYPFKYKKRLTEAASTEYAILFRLEELYLIRAEARARQGNLDGAKTDLNKVRLRAALPAVTSNVQQEVTDAIMRERRVELFTEHGHRWLDLKRTGGLGAALSTKPGWNATDALWPLPEQELLLNPNLLPQNGGY